MGQPNWRPLKSVKVPAEPGQLWTPALDYVTPSKLYKLTVEPAAPDGPPAPAPAPAPVPVAQTWRPVHGATGDPPVSLCTADGNPALNREKDTTPLLDSCAVGALIGKIGGGGADWKAVQDKVTIFAVGRHCVFVGPETAKTGALYLGVNDTPALSAGLRDSLEVTIWDAV